MKALCGIASRLPYQRGTSLLSMFEHGEGRLGLEMMIENLYEFEVAISRTEIALLHTFAADYSLDQKFISMIHELETEPAKP